MTDDDILLQIHACRNAIRDLRNLDENRVILNTRYPADLALVGLVNGTVGKVARHVVMDRLPELKGKQRELTIRSLRLKALGLLLSRPDLDSTAASLTGAECRGILDWATEMDRVYTGTEPIHVESPDAQDAQVQLVRVTKSGPYLTLYALMVRPELATAALTLPALER